MKTLVLLRGIQGSGKSSFIDRNHILEPYVISSDKIRLLFQTPVLNNFDGNFCISNKNDRIVWNFINELIETKMQHGEFIVLDAMNLDVSKYIPLSKKYNYDIHVINFDIPLEECLNRNKYRDSYKFVPEDIVRKCYDKFHNIKIPSTVHCINYTDDSNIRTYIDNLIYFNPIDLSKYDKIVVFGDIHGCYSALEKYFNSNEYNENNYYIFTGDYIDRGIENEEVLKFCLINQKFCSKNFCFLEGNHEFWLKNYIRGEYDEDIKNNQMNICKSKEFFENTIPQICKIDKKELIDFCNNLLPMKFIVYNNQKYLITHAGFSGFNNQFGLISDYDFYHGGKYEDDIDKSYEKQYNKMTDKIIQIHAHRNIFEYEIDQFNHSLNLCDQIEFGGYLRIVEINKNYINCIKIKNDVFKTSINPWKR